MISIEPSCIIFILGTFITQGYFLEWCLWDCNILLGEEPEKFSFDGLYRSMYTLIIQHEEWRW